MAPVSTRLTVLYRIYRILYRISSTWRMLTGNSSDISLYARELSLFVVDFIVLFCAKWSEVAQSCPSLCDPIDCSLLGSSIHGIFQARILEWVAISFSIKLVLEKAEEPEIKLPTPAGSSKKKESSRKHLFLFYWLCQSLWLCGSQ